MVNGVTRQRKSWVLAKRGGRAGVPRVPAAGAMMLRRCKRSAAAIAAAAAGGAMTGCIQSQAPDDAVDGYQLVHADVFFRHGARAPVHLNFPGLNGVAWDDCNARASRHMMHRGARVTSLSGGPPPASKVDEMQQSFTLPGGCRQGELTTTGVHQAHALGGALRARYGSLLAARSDGAGGGASAIEVRSTNVSRCIATARAVLGGLLPDDASAIAIRTVPNASEDLTPAPRRCGRLAELWDEARREWTRHANATHPLSASTTARLRALMGDEAAREYGFENGRWVPLKDVLTSVGALPSAKGHVPFAIPSDLVADVDALGAAQAAHLMGEGRSLQYKHEISRISLGAALQRLLSRLEGAAAADPSVPRLSLTSGHDTTILPLLTSLNLWDGFWPPFTAAVSFELWMPRASAAAGGRSSSETRPPIVRVLYSPGDGVTVGGGFRELVRWHLPHFAAMTAPLAPADITAECTAHGEPGAVRKMMTGTQF